MNMLKIFGFSLIKGGGGRRRQRFKIFFEIAGLSGGDKGLLRLRFRRRKNIQDLGERPVKKLGGFVDSFNKIDDPLIKRSIFKGDKSEGKAKKGSKGSESKFNNKVGAGVKSNPGNDKTNSQFGKLLKSHVAN